MAVITDAMRREFMSRLSGIFPPGRDWNDPVLHPRALEEIAGLVASGPEFDPVAGAFLAAHPDAFADADDAVARFKRMMKLSGGPLAGAARLFAESPAPAVPPALVGLIESRKEIALPADEPDALADDRPFVSVKLALERRRAADMSLEFVMEERPLNVTEIRNDALAGLTAVLMNKPVPGFRRSFVRGTAVSAHRLDADFHYRRDFPYLNTIIATASDISYCFDRPIDLTRLAILLKGQGDPFAVEGDEDRGRIDVGLQGTPIFTASPYKVTISLGRLLGNRRGLEDALNITTRVIEGIYQDKIFSAESHVVHMRELRAFISALSDSGSSTAFQELGAFLRGVLEMDPSRRLEYFAETARSRINTRTAQRKGLIALPARFILRSDIVQYPPHIKYVLIEDKWPNEICVGFDLLLEIDQFWEIAASLGLAVEEIKERSWRQVGSRTVRRSRRWVVYLNEDTGAGRKPLMEFGRKSVLFPLRQKGNRAGQAFSFLDALFDRGAFVTATIRDRMFDAGLTGEETALLDVWNLFRSLFGTFVRIGLDMEMAKHLLKGEKITLDPPSAEEWILGRLRESPDKRPEARLLFALRAVRDAIDTEKLDLYGPSAGDLFRDLIARIAVLYPVVNPPDKTQGGGGSPPFSPPTSASPVPTGGGAAPLPGCSALPPLGIGAGSGSPVPPLPIMMPLPVII